MQLKAGCVAVVSCLAFVCLVSSAPAPNGNRNTLQQNRMHTTPDVKLQLQSQRTHPISPSLYGVFFEEINFAGEGGLYAELVRNRDFEALGRGPVGSPNEQQQQPRNSNRISLKYTPPSPIYSDFRPWVSVVHGAAKLVSVRTDNTTQMFSSNPTTLRIEASSTACDGCGAGVSNPGYWGIPFAPSLTYNLTLSARTSDPNVNLDIFLEDNTTGQRVATGSLKGPSRGKWEILTTTLSPSKDATTSQANCSLVVLFSTNTDASFVVWIDSVSLIPSNAVAGLFRYDLFSKLSTLSPNFVRFPGGNYLEGYDTQTHWDWKKTVMPWQERSGHFNSAWGYWTNDGLGLLEYLILCEQLNATAQLSVFTSYSMGQPYPPLNQSMYVVKDALDALEFANGNVSTAYGKMRSDLGHAAPFNLARLEVGNEELLMAGYKEHYEAITDAIWASDPNITVIASGRWGPSVDGSPCLSGLRCDLWDDHYYRSPDQMASMGNQYDTYNRSLPIVFVGEYAANDTPDKQGTIQSAVAESVFMLGFEQNCDVVHASSFAPLFANTNLMQWGYNLINFNASAVFAIPSYYVQTMLQQNLGDWLLSVSPSPSVTRVSNVSSTTAWKVVATLKTNTSRVNNVTIDTVSIKVANYAAEGLNVDIMFDNDFEFANPNAALLTLQANDPQTANSLEQPENVVPVSGWQRVDVDIRHLGLYVGPWGFMIANVQVVGKSSE